MHVYHDRLLNFHPDQILHDGCPECEARAAEPDHGIAHLDAVRFERAWVRAAVWQTRGLATVSNAELPMLKVLRTIQVQLERRGIPLGQCPVAR